jgi:hypothetical protein
LGFADDRWVTLGIRFDSIKALDGFTGTGETQRDLRFNPAYNYNLCWWPNTESSPNI